MDYVPDTSTTPGGLHLAETSKMLASQPWFDEVVASWPAPVAHELARLNDLLHNGLDTGGALFQIRDTAEVLLKATTLVIVRDLAVNAPDVADEAHKVLLTNKLSLGSWVGALRSLARLTPGESSALFANELRVLGTTDSKFYKAVDRYVALRNNDIGHGAYRRDSLELANAIREQLFGVSGTARAIGLADAFAEVHATGFWKNYKLHVTSETGPEFTGATSAARSSSATIGSDDGRSEPLVLVGPKGALNLSPFLKKRICGECHNRDAFVYDSPYSMNPTRDGRFYFTDYANGHRIRIDAGAADSDLAEILSRAVSADVEQKAGGEFSTQAVVDLLEDIMFDQRYVRPDWIRRELQDHLSKFGAGVFWLEAPAHIGKSMFVRGIQGDWLGDDKAKKERALLGKDIEIDMISIFLKREFTYTIEGFARALESKARNGLIQNTNYKLDLPKSGTPSELQEGFLKYAKEAVAASRESTRRADRLIIAIDGLDELPEPVGLNAGLSNSPVDFFPPADQLPEGITLLLTSRPVGDTGCPAWMMSKMGSRYSDMGGCRRLRADTRTPGYVQLLQDYVANHSGFNKSDPSFDRVWHSIYEKSDGLFLFVSFLCDLMKLEFGEAAAV